MYNQVQQSLLGQCSVQTYNVDKPTTLTRWNNLVVSLFNFLNYVSATSQSVMRLVQQLAPL